jgi:DNA-binding transcriptional LysR family regulator
VRHVSCIREGLADVAFLRPPYAPDELAGMEVEVIFQEPRAALLSSDHPLAARDELFCADVVNERFIEGVPDVSPTWRRFWLLVDERGGEEPDLYESRISSAEELLELVASGCGIAVTPLSLGAGLRRDDLKAVPVADIAPAPLALGWRAGDTSSELADFLAVAREEAGLSTAARGR